MMARHRFSSLCLCLVLLTSLAHAESGAPAGTAERPGKTTAHRTAKDAVQVGIASWYGVAQHGKRTASGAKFDMNQFTAAHRTLPLHTLVRVTNLANGRSVTVVVTDRGPRNKSRIIDLSQSAAEEIGMAVAGVARVQVEPILVANAAH